MQESERSATSVADSRQVMTPLDGRGPRKDNPSTKQAIEVVSRDCVTDNTRNHQKALIKQEHHPKTKKQQRLVSDEPKTDDTELENSKPPSPEVKELAEKTSKVKSDHGSTHSKDATKKKATNPTNNFKHQPERISAAESKKKTTSQASHVQPVEDGPAETKQEQKQTSRKESPQKQSSPNSNPSKKSPPGKGQEGNGPTHSPNKTNGGKSCGSAGSDVKTVETSHSTSRRYKDGPEPIATSGRSASSSSVEESNRGLTKGSSTSAHSHGSRMGLSENEREHKQGTELHLVKYDIRQSLVHNNIT